MKQQKVSFVARLSLSTKILLIISVGLVATLVLTFISIFFTDTLVMVKNVATSERRHSVQLNDAKANLYKYFLTHDPVYRDNYEANITVANNYSHTFSKLVEYVGNQPDAETKAEVQKIFQEYPGRDADVLLNRLHLLGWHPLIGVLIETAKGADAGTRQYRDQAAAMMESKGNYDFKKLTEIEVHISDFENRFAQGVGDLATFVQLLVNITTWVLLVIVGAVSVIVALRISRHISKPIKQLSEKLGQQSKQIEDYSRQISGASSQIANGATEQAAAVEETTASMEEMASMTRNNAEIAQVSLKNAQATAEITENGSVEMGKMLEAMQAINTSSDDIKGILDVIEDIAFQTNMLALNAAVEAARAGEAGMGFAVVADEVKNLANRSSENAKEIGKMIKGSIKRSEGGLEIAQNLSAVLTEITGRVKSLATMCQEIAQASQQQDQGIQQINGAILQFDAIVQANVSVSVETADSAQAMQLQVGVLKEIGGELTHIINGGRTKSPSDQAPAKAETKPKPKA
jgi:methyl-accepting chemotaxis protein